MINITDIDNNTTFNPIFTLAYLSTDVPPDLMKKINIIIDNMMEQKFSKSIPFNSTLVGAIQNEYVFESPEGDSTVDELEEFTGLLSQVYWKRYGETTLAQKKHIFTSITSTGKKDIWINFQKKYEYNPMHYHSGALSWVIWSKIPYSIEEELDLPHVKNSNAAGFTKGPTFQFVYPDFYNPGGVNHYPIKVDKTYEGKIILFNARLQHLVTPFYTSDDYRISLSSNMIQEP